MTQKPIAKSAKQKQKTSSGAGAERNPRLPIDNWFQRPPEGLTLFTVIYTRACRWRRCLGCTLPSLSSPDAVSFADIMAQADYLFDFHLTGRQKSRLKKIILSNNGSVLDEATCSTTALLYFVAKMNLNCPSLSVFTLETRAEYVDTAELEVLSRALREGRSPTRLELAIGFEAFDDQIRNRHFRKGLRLADFEALVEKVARHRFGLKVYFMLKPVPGLGEAEAVDDIVRGIDYLDRLAGESGVAVNLHLNPTYVARGTDLEKAFLAGDYTPPRLESVRQAVLAASGKRISLYIGLYDEGLAVPGGGFIRRGDAPLLKKLHAFNRTGDFSLLGS